MSINLIQSDVKLMRDRYDEALQMMGIPAKYQYPILADSNNQGESLVDHYSISEDVHIFFEGSPKIKTYKRVGWVVENDENLPFLIHCSFNLKNLQRDCIFTISGQYSEVSDRVFRVREITTDLQCPDHVMCQVIPVYGNDVVGRTKKQVSQKFNKSNTFLSKNYDYRGQQYDTKNEEG